ncbi:Armadillo-type fold protein [Actinidia chinensis var. chinensis]|uniref:Armadillo-type fold protein n=1 Tax=Actinidia chinensis var. chinensis TaxID=1590841 RepID=A0A2R6P4I3_ACTCC|nr:Armadillo-type fold protein [Actinidia chinensis var. chinensis]
MDHGQDTEDRGSVHLQIDELGDSGPTIFEPQSSIDTKNSSNSNWVPSPSRPPVLAPEKKLTLFALRLAVLEKAATGLGTLGFIWATVVLLGGFAITLDKTDFWFITIILLIEGTRIFSRSHELEWQHQATWSIADMGINSFRAIRSSSHFIIKTVKAIFRPIDAVRKQSRHSRELTKSMYLEKSRRNWDLKKVPTRTWVTSDVPILPYGQWVFLTRNISKLLYWLQLASATTCAALSLMKLIKHNFGEVEKGDTDKRNRKSALTIFYALALAEALLFLLEKIYWEWTVIYCKVLHEVNKECELGPSGMISIRRFFYDAYSRCVNGSIFDGLKMDMVSFAMDLLGSSSPDEQLIGVRILQKFATNERFSNDTLQKIGITLPVMERLVEMLNWKDPEEEEIRQSAAEILSKLTGKKQNSLRVVGIPGALESISSLLQNHRALHGAADEICEKRIIHDNENYSFWTFNHLGLLILKKLARDHENCGKIGNTRGLLPKIIDFTHAGERLLKDETVTPSQILTVKRSLQVLKMLASTTGTTGKQLRNEISEVVFTISNIRDVLRYGEKHPELQKLGIEIFSSLAMEEDATERIGGTGGVLRELLNIFFKQEMPENQNHVRIAAGEALAMLALESKSNCHQFLKLKVIDRLVEALEVPLLRINAARILTNLCTYAGVDCFMELRGVTSAIPTILRAIMSEENKLQEVMVGLAARVFKYMPAQESSVVFKRAGIRETELASALVQILNKHQNPPIKTPRIRRFVIELAICMMKDKETNVQVFKDLGMIKELECVMETTCELENFNVFSGAVGMSRHSTTIHSLVETSMKLLEDK